MALFSFSLFSQEAIVPLSNTKTSATVLPGLYQSFEEFIKINEEKFQRKINAQGNRASDLSDMAEASNVEFDVDFLNAVIFQTPGRFLALGSKDRCSFYDLILSDLLRSPEKEFTSLLVKYQDNKGEIVTRLVRKDVFVSKVISVQCPQSLRFQQYFNAANVQKTLKTVKFKTPSSMDECLSIHRELISDYKTPYLCQIHSKIDKIESLNREIRNTPTSQYQKLGSLRAELRAAQNYSRMLNQDAVGYLENLCENVEKPKVFCEGFFQTNFWSKAIKSEGTSFALESRCKSLLNKSTLTKADYDRCAQRLQKDNNACFYAGVNPALYPASSCEMTGDLLNHSRLNTNYQECPGLTPNSASTNAARVLQQLIPLQNESQTNCAIVTAESLLKFSFPIVEDKIWGVSACYRDQINNSNICLPTYFGDYGNSDYSISKVVARILYRTKGTSSRSTCNLVTASAFNPAILTFKSGCHIITPDRGCMNADCNIRIILEDKTIDHITFKNNSSFDYFPFSFQTEKFSFTKLTEIELKRNSKQVMNLSNLKFYFKQNANTILHGIGCREMLLPRFYKQTSFNQCTPLPFIVDGYKEKDQEVSLIVRTAYDDLQAPRLISWNYIYQAVSSYQSRHPLKIWGLHAVY